MNIEGVKNDSKATPLKALKPPEMSSGQKLDGSTPVLDYNEILQSMEGERGQPVDDDDDDDVPEEYYEEEEPIDDEYIIPERPRRRRVTFQKPVRHHRRPVVVVEPECENRGFVWKYRRTILVAVVAAVALYVLTMRLPGWLPSSVGPTGGFSMIGMAIVALAIASGFFVGDTYVLSTWKGH